MKKVGLIGYTEKAISIFISGYFSRAKIFSLQSPYRRPIAAYTMKLSSLEISSRQFGSRKISALKLSLKEICSC